MKRVCRAGAQQGAQHTSQHAMCIFFFHMYSFAFDKSLVSDFGGILGFVLSCLTLLDV